MCNYNLPVKTSTQNIIMRSQFIPNQYDYRNDEKQVEVRMYRCQRPARCTGISLYFQHSGLRQEDCEFKDNLGYILRHSFQKNLRGEKNKRKTGTLICYWCTKWSSLSNKAVPPRADHDEVYVQEEKTIPTHLYVDIYSSIIHHMQKVETTKMPSNW